jgi:transcriptional regulator with XRE-family HTH domain
MAGRVVLTEYQGLPYRLDLARCCRAFEELRIEGELADMRALAAKIGVSLSTVSRFFSGRLPSMTVLLKILQELRLAFEDVATRDDQEGTAGVGVRPR